MIESATGRQLVKLSPISEKVSTMKLVRKVREIDLETGLLYCTLTILTVLSSAVLVLAIFNMANSLNLIAKKPSRSAYRSLQQTGDDNFTQSVEEMKLEIKELKINLSVSVEQNTRLFERVLEKLQRALTQHSARNKIHHASPGGIRTHSFISVPIYENCTTTQKHCRMDTTLVGDSATSVRCSLIDTSLRSMNSQYLMDISCAVRFDNFTQHRQMPVSATRYRDENHDKKGCVCSGFKIGTDEPGTVGLDCLMFTTWCPAQLHLPRKVP